MSDNPRTEAINNDIYERIQRGDFKPTEPWCSSKKNPWGHKKYIEDVKHKNALFKQALFAAYELEDYSQREVLFLAAWERGHAHGMWEVANEFDRLVELLKQLGSPHRLIKYAKAWAAQGARSKWSTAPSLALYDEVQRITKETS